MSGNPLDNLFIWALIHGFHFITRKIEKEKHW